MAKVLLTDPFLEAAARVWSDKVRDRIEEALRAVESFPLIASDDVPPSIRERFGESVRKLVVKPFDLIYEYDEAADAVYVYDLVHFREAR